MAYSAYVLTPQSRDLLLQHFPPQFDKIVAHHCTYAFPDKITPPTIQSILVIGYASNDQIECLVVTIDGSFQRPSGGIYHITWSLDSEKNAKPKSRRKQINTSNKRCLKLGI